MSDDEKRRQEWIELRNSEHLRRIRLEEMRAQNRRVQESLKAWAERTPERAA